MAQWLRAFRPIPSPRIGWGVASAQRLPSGPAAANGVCEGRTGSELLNVQGIHIDTGTHNTKMYIYIHIYIYMYVYIQQYTTHISVSNKDIYTHHTLSR